MASALTTRGLCAELFEVVLQSHDLLIAEAVFRELQRILPEKPGQTEAISNGFIALLRAEGQVITPNTLCQNFPILMTRQFLPPHWRATPMCSSQETRPY
jgi:hypothetical protein